MSGVNQFEKNVQQYEQWFLDHPLAYVSELHAIRELLPGGNGLEIGVGTGRFAAPLGIRTGIDPSPAMTALAAKKGIEVVTGVAEKLPFTDGEFDFALMVTTVCFLDDRDAAFREAFRVIRPGGAFIIGFVDRNTPLGREYLAKKNSSTFYKDATFYAVNELVEACTQAGFDQLSFRQTLFGPLTGFVEPDKPREGHGQGSFVVVRALKPVGIGGVSETA